VSAATDHDSAHIRERAREEYALAA